MVDFADLIFSLDFSEILGALFTQSWFNLVFPFLLIFAVLQAVLSRSQLFRSKKTGLPLKAPIVIVSGSFAIYGSVFETSQGYTIGDLLSFMFPSISTLTVMVLALYVVGAMLGKNFFKGIFRKDVDAIMYFVVGGIGLGSVIFYLGIVMGLWDFNPLDATSQWNVILGLTLFVVGIIFLIIDQIPLAVLLFSVLGVFVYNFGQGSILEYFIDPFVFIFFIVVALISWLGSPEDEKVRLAMLIRDDEKLIETYRQAHGGQLPQKPHESRVYDIVSLSYKDRVEKWNKLFPDDPEGWKKTA